jgi:hypothetical protein
MAKGNELGQKQSSDIVKPQEFQPTPHMQVWLDTQVRLQTDVVDEIERESKIADAHWSRWCKEVKGFEDWYWNEYDKRTRRWKPTIDAIGMKFAKKGSAEHFKYLAQRVGNIREEKEKNIVPVQINNFINKEKDEFGI